MIDNNLKHRMIHCIYTYLGELLGHFDVKILLLDQVFTSARSSPSGVGRRKVPKFGTSTDQSSKRVPNLEPRPGSPAVLAWIQYKHSSIHMQSARAGYTV